MKNMLSMLPQLEENRTLYKVLAYLLLIGLSLFLTGYFWQAKTTRLQTVYYLLVVAPVVFSLWHQIKDYPLNPLFYLAFIFILYSSLSFFWSDNITLSSAFHVFKKFVLLMSLFLAVNYVIKRFPRFEYVVLHLMLFFASVLAVYNIYDLSITEGLSGRISGWGVLDNANITAEVFGLIFIFAAIQFLETDNKLKVAIYFFICLLVIVEIFLNKSRGQQLALFIAILLIVFATPKERLKRLLPIVTVTVIGAILVFFFTDLFETIFNRKLGFSCRDTIWRDLLEQAALNSPIFGRGSGASAGYTTYCLELSPEALKGTHSVYMSIFLYQGAVGVLLALTLTIFAIYAAYRSKNKMDLFWAIIIIYGFIAFLPNGDSLVARPNERWMLFWIPLAFITSRYGFNREQMANRG